MSEAVTPTTKSPAREYYKVLLVSSPGKGKTYSFRNVDPLTFGLVNIENKPLPFKKLFMHHVRPTNRVEAYNAIVELAKNPEIKAIGIDSFSAYTDMLMEEARRTKKGFDVFNFYNEELAKFLTLIKKIQKEVVMTSHYEIIGMEGNMEKRVKVKGKEWEGVVEKEFTVVMFGDNKFQDSGKPEYFFKLAEEYTSAKCPPEIFGEGVYKIPNDVNIILEKIVDFAV